MDTKPAHILLTEREVGKLYRMGRTALYKARQKSPPDIPFITMGRTIRYPLAGLPEALQREYLQKPTEGAEVLSQRTEPVPLQSGPDRVSPVEIVVLSIDELERRIEAAVARVLAARESRPIAHGEVEGPDATRLHKMPAVSKRVSICPSSIRARIKCGTFPPADRMEGPHWIWKSTTIDRFIEHGYPFPTP